jgi:hypothetical protein
MCHVSNFKLPCLDIERVVLLGNGADAITDQISNRPRFVQEPVNAQEQNETCLRSGVDGRERERCSQRHDPRTTTMKINVVMYSRSPTAIAPTLIFAR